VNSLLDVLKAGFMFTRVAYLTTRIGESHELADAVHDILPILHERE
jgi:hypothetical protein